MNSGYENALRRVVESDTRFIVMTAENRGAIRNLPAVLHERFIDVGIAEQTLVGAAAGLALRGRTVVAHALATFLTMRAFEFIRTDVGLPQLPVKLVGGVPGFLSEANGPTHQALEDIALMRAIPGMGIFCPADEQDLEIGLEQVLRSEQPYYIRHNPLPAALEHESEFELGRAEMVLTGRDVAILTYGALFTQGLEAAEILQARRYSVRLVNLRTLRPLDRETVLEAVANCRLVVTLEDHFLTGGLYTILSELLLQSQITARVLPLALADRWFKPGLYRDVLQYEGFTGAQIADKVEGKLND